jgi:hypothetical protein
MFLENTVNHKEQFGWIEVHLRFDGEKPKNLFDEKSAIRKKK